MIKPSKKYLDYVKAIINMYKLGFFHQFEVSQQKFDALTVEQQNRLIADVTRIRTPEQYVTLQDGKRTKMDKALYERIMAQNEKMVKNHKKLGDPGFTGKPIYMYFQEFNPNKMTPQTKREGGSLVAVARIVRKQLVAEIEELANDCKNPELHPSLVAYHDVLKPIVQGLYTDYMSLIPFIVNLDDDALLVMVEKTDGLSSVLSYWWEEYVPRELNPVEVFNDTAESTRMGISSIITARW